MVVLYNFAAGSFHTKKRGSRLYSIGVEVYLKKQKMAFEPPFGGISGNYAVHI